MLIPLKDLEDAAKTSRSSLYRWMIDNHDRFLLVTKKAVRPNWAALTEMFTTAGLRNAEGTALTEVVTKRTWLRARKAVAARRAARKKRLRPKDPDPGIVQPAAASPHLPAPALFDPRPAGAPAPRPRYTFQLAKLRKYPEE